LPKPKGLAEESSGSSSSSGDSSSAGEFDSEDEGTSKKPTAMAAPIQVHTYVYAALHTVLGIFYLQLSH